MEFNAHVTKITEDKVYYDVDGEEKSLENDFVFAMTGYRPDVDFLTNVGINVDRKTGKPEIDEETLETNLENVYVAGVVISGFNGNETFIENGRFHGTYITQSILAKEQGN